METNSVVMTLAKISREIDAQQHEIESFDVEAVHARAAFEVAYARAFLEGDGPMDVRKQNAILETADEKFKSEIADQKLRAARGRIQVLRDRLEVGRSMNATARSEFLASGVGQP